MLDRASFPRVQLAGAETDLKSLTALLRHGDHQVTAEEGGYWWRSTEFDALVHDPASVREKALELLPVINGAAKLAFPRFEPIEVGQCVDYLLRDGHPKRKLTAMFRLHVRSPEAAREESAAALVKRARGDEKAANALRLWGSATSHDWGTLYKLKEKVEAAVGGAGEIAQRGWATKTELRLFERTANSHAVLGDAARHGVQMHQPPADPMTLSDAQELIGRLIRRWLS